MDVRCWPKEGLAYEAAYNLKAQRLSPPVNVGFPFEGAWCVVAPGETATPHSHHEREIFFFIGGTGSVRVGTERTAVGYGDEVHIRPGDDHDVTNDGTEDLIYLAIWFPTGEKTTAA